METEQRRDKWCDGWRREVHEYDHMLSQARLSRPQVRTPGLRVFFPSFFFSIYGTAHGVLSSTGIYAHETNICMYTTVIHIILVPLV
jgi:hypothetical protein